MVQSKVVFFTGCFNFKLRTRKEYPIHEYSSEELFAGRGRLARVVAVVSGVHW